MRNVAFISSGYYPLYVSYAALYAACCALGIYAEYVLGCYVLRGDVCFLQGDTIARSFFVHCVRIVSEQRLI